MARESFWKEGGIHCPFAKIKKRRELGEGERLFRGDIRKKSSERTAFPRNSNDDEAQVAAEERESNCTDCSYPFSICPKKGKHFGNEKKKEKKEEEANFV